MDDYGTNYDWGGENDTADSVHETDFLFGLEQQAENWQGMDENDIFMDGLMGGGIGPWKISLSAQALKDLQQSRGEGNHIRIFAKLQSLASGDWVRRSVARPFPPCGRHFRVRLFQALYSGNGRILWQVDVGYDEKCGSLSQIVRVWSIGDIKEIHASLDAVERSQRTFSATRVERCKRNFLDMTAGLKLPVVFESSLEDENREGRNPEAAPDTSYLPEQEFVAQDMLISGKFHTLTVNVFSSIIHRRDDLDFPFDVTGPEATIIKHKDATFILGRSGTGKTSCLLYKLMCRYLARNRLMPVTGEPIRQLLLTRSKPLAQKLHSDLKLLIDTQLLRQANHDNRHEGGNSSPGQVNGMDMDADTTEDFLSLRTEDFPFVCTFDHFLRRLENTIMVHDRTSISSRRLIDYTIFREGYWPHFPFPPGFKARLQPEMVFTEFMGVLKSGVTTLSRQEYIKTSTRSAPTFTLEGDRQVVYTLFEQYEKRKRAQDEQDGVDRVRSVMKALERNLVVRGILVGMFEEVYVDEVQDQRPLEISLLLTLVQNPRGIHFAGDSAQCISQDSTFRFANLKTLFFNHFSAHPLAAVDPSVAKATRFPLSHNFRSHQGILSLASWVMDKLWRGFPDLVDKLPPEIGTYTGPKPVIIIGPSLVSFLQVAAGSTTGDETKNQQNVIVRDHTVKAELEPKLSEGSLIFTVLESKGMEWDDVFLYEFFSRSPNLAGFRNMMDGSSWEGYAESHANMCSELKNLYVAITRPRSRLFILESNPGLIPDLLTEHVPVPLVVVKRFKDEDLQNLSHEVCRDSTPSLHAQREQTGATSPGPGGIFDAVRPTKTTTVKQWIETGNQCMERGIFDQAIRCFRNAKSLVKVKWATASLSEQRGKECSARRETLGARHHFKEASDLFLELGMNDRAASCLEARGDFAIAAELFRAAGRYEKAARLYKKVGQYSRAADEYLRCGKPSMALLALYEGKHYERLISEFLNHHGEIPDKDRLIYAPACNKYVRQKSSLRLDLQSRALAMFTSDDEKETFLKKSDYTKELVEFYVCRGRIKEALLHAVTSDDFDDALAGMIERGQDYNNTVVVKELEKEDMRLEDVFNYAQTKRLLASMSGESKRLCLNYKGRYEGIKYGQEWERFVDVAGEYIESGMKLDRRCIREEWIKEYLDTIVSANVKYFLGVAKDQAAIPHAYLYGLAQRIDKISKSIKEKENLTSTTNNKISKSTTDNGIPKAMLLALGVMQIPVKVKPYKVLRWSPLYSPKVGGNDFECKVIVKKIVEYLTKRLQEASPLVEKNVKALWEGFSGIEKKCTACMTRVAWGEPHVEGQSSKCSHNIITKVEFEKSLQDIIGFHSSLASLAEEYKLLRGVKPPDYLSHLNDYWLDALLNRLTYHSACFQSAECIVNLCKGLRKPGNILGSALRRRFRKCWESWKAMGCKEDFTCLLESYQLGVNLGLRWNDLDHLINTRQIEIEAYEKKSPGGSGPSRNQQQKLQPSEGVDIIFEALRQYRTLHEWHDPSEWSMGTLLSWFDNLLLTLRDMLQSTTYLSFIHASVISIFESIMTLLLFASHRTNIVIPSSWKHLYLPLWGPTLTRCTDNEMDCYRRTIVRTMSLFCEWVIESHKNTLQEGSLQRRCLDLCFVVLVNIGTVPECQGLWARAQKVLTNKKTLDKSQTRDVQRHQLIAQLFEAFKLYNGTDTLTLHVGEGPLDRRALYLSRFATRLRLPSLPYRPPPPLDTLYSRYLITSWYRRRRLIRTEYKKYMESDEWKMVNRLQALCNHNLPLSVAVMTDGLDLYMQLQELSRKIDVAEGREKKRAEKGSSARSAPQKKGVDVVVSRESEITSAKGSKAADKLAETAKTESEILHVQLQERNAFFSVGTTVDVGAEAWREKCREEKVAIQEMEKILQDWVDRLDGKVKKVESKKPGKGSKMKAKKAKPVPPARGGKGKQSRQTPPELSENEGEGEEAITEDEKEEETEVGLAASRKTKRKAKKKKSKRGKR